MIGGFNEGTGEVRAQTEPAGIMSAIVQAEYGPAEVLELGRMPAPVADDGQVLVRVVVAGTHIGDWHVMTGLPKLVRVMGFGLRRPKRPVRGSDFAGIVEAVGKNVGGFQPGDEVFGVCDGSFAEYALAKPEMIVPKPPDVSFEQAAALPTSGVTALQALRDKGRLQPGQRVLVIGAGGAVGSYAVQLAKVFGAHVTGVCSTVKLDLVRSLGADEVIDYTSNDTVGKGERFDLIVDTAGGRSLSTLRKALIPHGALVMVGGEGGGRLIGILRRSLRAMFLSPFVSQRFPWLVAAIRPEDMATLATLVVEGRMAPVIERTYPLAEVPAAMAYIGSGHARGKTVITV